VLKSRGGYDGGIPSVPTGGDPVAMETYRNPIAVYWDALRMVLGDLQITDDEITELQNLKEELGLVEEQIRAMHTRAFIGVLSRFVDDFYLDEKECQTVGRLHRCLSLLGWAPGEV